MIKLGGIVCDVCRILISGVPISLIKSITPPNNETFALIDSTTAETKMYIRRSKSGKLLHLCSEKCLDNPIKKREG
jgi:hypothetical protein